MGTNMRRSSWLLISLAAKTRLFALVTILVVLFQACIPAMGMAQSIDRIDYNWVLGNGSPSIDSLGLILNFVNGSRSIQTVSRPVNMFVTNSSISDTNGDLVLYTNGCEIYDTLDSVIENGSGLNPGEIHDGWCESGYFARDGAVFIPLSDTLIGLYHIGLSLVHNPVLIFANKL